jgi:hypothetical protein
MPYANVSWVVWVALQVCDHTGNPAPDGDSPCKPGYNENLDSREHKQWTPYTCDKQGTWTQSESATGAHPVALSCSAKPCDGFPATYLAEDDPIHTSHDPHTKCADTAAHPTGNNLPNGDIGDACSASCTTGYNPAAGTFTYTCLNDLGNRTAYWGVGRGDGPKLACTGQACDAIQPGWPDPSPNTRKCDAGAYGDNGDPDFKFTGSEVRARARETERQNTKREADRSPVTVYIASV